jgi:hypothetical protein
VVWWDVWIGVFKEGTILDNDLHTKRCSQLLIQMSI